MILQYTIKKWNHHLKQDKDSYKTRQVKTLPSSPTRPRRPCAGSPPPWGGRVHLAPWPARFPSFSSRRMPPSQERSCRGRGPAAPRPASQPLDGGHLNKNSTQKSIFICHNNNKVYTKYVTTYNKVYVWVTKQQEYICHNTTRVYVSQHNKVCMSWNNKVFVFVCHNTTKYIYLSQNNKVHVFVTTQQSIYICLSWRHNIYIYIYVSQHNTTIAHRKKTQHRAIQHMPQHNASPNTKHAAQKNEKKTWWMKVSAVLYVAQQLFLYLYS